MELMTAFNLDSGITIVMVTHDAVMAAYARRIVRFIDGIIDIEEQNGG